MKNVQTVTGTVATDKLGSVLMHEHIYSSSMGELPSAILSFIKKAPKRR